MALALLAFKIEKDGTCKTKHTFYGETERECDELMEAHAAHCPEFGPAVKRGDVISYYIEIDEIPDRRSITADMNGDDEDNEE